MSRNFQAQLKLEWSLNTEGELSCFAAVPVPQAETWKTVCNAPGPLDVPSPLLAAANLHGLRGRENSYTNVGRGAFQPKHTCGKLTEGAWAVTSDGAGGRTEPWWRRPQGGAEMTILRQKLGDPLCLYCWHTWRRQKGRHFNRWPSACKSSLNINVVVHNLSLKIREKKVNVLTGSHSIRTGRYTSHTSAKTPIIWLADGNPVSTF